MDHVHKPVMQEEVIASLINDNTKYYLDCTTGEGGHTEAILSRYKGVFAYCMDRDREILEVAAKRLLVFNERFKTINMNFRDIDRNHIDFSKVEFDAALIDLGISVYHYKKSKKGFSFNSDERLDMRLDEESTSVYDIINKYSEEELTEIFYKYAEERFSRNISRKIVVSRSKKPIEKANELSEIIESSVPKKFQSKKIHPATKCFQALRIVANNEFENIEKGIPKVLSVLKKGGRLGVITFHSLEDRIVKNIFNELNKDCICPKKAPVCTCNKKRELVWISKKIMPSEEEIKNNPPSRSAKLRVVEKL